MPGTVRDVPESVGDVPESVGDVPEPTSASATGPAAGPATVFFSVGHSTLELPTFLEMLDGAGVSDVVDVRRLPGSRRYPWFDQDPLRESLSEAGLGYHHVPALTGRRPRQREVPPEVNAFWQNQSFHNYADYALSPEFGEGLDQLRTACGGRPVLLCSEAVWWRCHRRIIVDWLLAAGQDVRHLMGPGAASPARLTPGAVVGAGGRVTYPAASD